jgi:hypothetical protein
LIFFRFLIFQKSTGYCSNKLRFILSDCLISQRENIPRFRRLSSLLLRQSDIRKSDAADAEKTFRTALYFAGTVTPGSRRRSCELVRCLSHREGAYYEISIITIKITRAGNAEPPTAAQITRPVVTNRDSRVGGHLARCRMRVGSYELPQKWIISTRGIRARPSAVQHFAILDPVRIPLHAEELWWSFGGREESIGYEWLR